MNERPKLWSESRAMVPFVRDLVIVGGGMTGPDTACVDYIPTSITPEEIVVDVESPVWLNALRKARNVYADGGVLRPRYCEVGSWAWVATDQDDNEVASQYGWIERGPSTPNGISNNISELIAACRALLWMAKATPGWSGRLCSDSQITLGRLSQGWRMKGIPELWVRRMALVLGDVGDVEFVHLKGHPTQADLEVGFKISRTSGRTYAVSRHQAKCDRLCNDMLKKWSEISGITR